MLRNQCRRLFHVFCCFPSTTLWTVKGSNGKRKVNPEQVVLKMALSISPWDRHVVVKPKASDQRHITFPAL